MPAELDKRSNSDIGNGSSSRINCNGWGGGGASKLGVVIDGQSSVKPVNKGKKRAVSKKREKVYSNMIKEKKEVKLNGRSWLQPEKL